MRTLLLPATIILHVILSTSYGSYAPIPTTEYLEKFHVIENTNRQARFTAAFYAMGVQPVTDSFVYANAFDITGQGKPFTLSPDWTFAFILETNLLLNHDIDIGVNWFSAGGSGRRTTTTEGNDLTIKPAPGMPNVGRLSRVRGDIDISNNTVNLEVGKTFYIEQTKNLLAIRLHAGGSYTGQDVDRNSRGNNLEGEEAFVLTSSSFDGGGPRIGVDVEAGLDKHFSVIAKTAGAVLFGQTTWQEQVLVVGGDDPYIRKRRQNQVAWTTDARVGLRYTKKINHGAIALETGYNVAAYFNSNRDNRFQEQNLIYHGPYLSLRISG